MELSRDKNTFLVQSFVGENLLGSPACVVILNSWLSDSELKSIAKRNAVPETAFVLFQQSEIEIRWFTPEIEMDLCGHATLAAAHVLFEQKFVSNNFIVFKSASGNLEIQKEREILWMKFPIREAVEAECPEIILDSFSVKPKEILKARDYIFVYDSEEEISKMEVNQEKLNTINIDTGGICITAVGSSCDFVSRFFTPQASIFEDPVTGSAHCSLVPYWSKRLNKNVLHAKQISKEGGELFCKLTVENVIIGGKAGMSF